MKEITIGDKSLMQISKEDISPRKVFLCKEYFKIL